MRYRGPITSDQWDPARYEKFGELRARPFWDLADLIEGDDPARPIRSMVDLGCGTGELTRRLADRLAVERCVGIDSSAAMLERTTAFADDRVTFVEGDAGRWSEAGAHDLVVANASLQWIPDHPAVLARWAGSLRPGGQLAVQVPANHDHPSHLASVTVAEREPFLSAMGGASPPDPVAANVLSPEAYAALLYERGFPDPHVRLQVYPQPLACSRDVVEWVRGTSLTRFFKLLPDDLHDEFVLAYTDELLARIGDRRPYFYGFKRILMFGRLG